MIPARARGSAVRHDSTFASRLVLMRVRPVIGRSEFGGCQWWRWTDAATSRASRAIDISTDGSSLVNLRVWVLTMLAISSQVMTANCSATRSGSGAPAVRSPSRTASASVRSPCPLTLTGGSLRRTRRQNADWDRLRAVIVVASRASCCGWKLLGFSRFASTKQRAFVVEIVASG